MKPLLGSMTRRERRFAVAGVIITLTLLLPLVAAAEPGLIPGSGPTPGTASATEQPADVERGDSCHDTLPADTPSYVVCRWLNPPQDAAAAAQFWLAEDGANLERAQPLPPEFIRCNQKSDLAKTGTCKGGETLCQQQPTGWYRCTDQVTRKVTYEGYVNGAWVVRSTPPSTAPSPTAPSPTATSTAATPSTAPPRSPAQTIDATAVLPAPASLATSSAPASTPAGTEPSTTGQNEPPPDGNPATAAPTLTSTTAPPDTPTAEPPPPPHRVRQNRHQHRTARPPKPSPPPRRHVSGYASGWKATSPTTTSPATARTPPRSRTWWPPPSSPA
ncbi:hypothetical protein ACFQ0B_76030 [Nonomuraea thailandensis]